MDIKCLDGCCFLTYEDFNCIIDNKKEFIKYKKMKGGGVLHDKILNKIVIVQSRGKLWGFPKGTKKDNETIENCVVREIKEETGINIPLENLTHHVKINNGKSVFYYIPYSETKLTIQNQIKNNDANGIGWIKVECLKKLLDNNIIQFNRQSKIILKNMFT